jgi:chromate transport protein ChrA
MSASTAPHREDPKAHDSFGSLFLRFLKFGCLAWGGPAAQIAMISKECVDDPRIRPFLLGVAAGVIGLIGAVTVDILESSVVDIPSGVLAALAFVLLYRFQAKLTVLFVVLGCGAVGALLQLTVL